MFAINPFIHLEHHLVIITVAIAVRGGPTPGAFVGIRSTGKGAAELALLVVFSTTLVRDRYEAGIAVAVTFGDVAVGNAGILDRS